MSDFSYTMETATDNRAIRRISLRGSMTSDRVGDLLLPLTVEFAGMDSVLLDFSPVTNIDSAGLKLVCELHRTLLASGKVLRLTGYNRAAMRAALPPQGYRRGSECGIEWHHSCIWLTVE